MQPEFYYISDEGNFSPKKFKDFLELNYELINNEYKPIVALRLKSFLVLDAIYSIPKLDRSLKQEYERILKEAFSVYGDIDRHIQDCIGKQVLYTLSWGETGAGTLKEFMNLSAELSERERMMGLTNIGYKITTKTGDKNMCAETLVLVTLVNNQ